MKRISLSLLIALTTAGAALSAPAMAAPRQETFSITMRYDATKSPKANYLTFRRQAATACGETNLGPLEVRSSQHRCTMQVLDKAVAQWGRMDLAQVHLKRTGRGAPLRALASRG